MTSKQAPGYVIYQGPSMLDGAPIVAIATGLGRRSTNVKTGAMVQTYILRADIAPTDALRTGDDSSICGDCKHRPYNGGACYVTVFQGPLVVYKAFKRGLYPMVDSAHTIDSLGAGRMVRLGTYGDPAAVPAYIWESLTLRASGRTGYTHQWHNTALPAWQLESLRKLVMASADDASEASEARAQGMRYFRIRTADEPMGAREFVCPASEEAGKRKTCATCMACDGTQRGAQQASPVIIVHGAKHKRFAIQRSL